MVILHVYNVSVFNAETGETHNENVVAMNTSEARDKVMLKVRGTGRLTWHIHELTRFNVE